MKITALRPFAAIAITGALALSFAPSATAAVTVPPNVATALATFPTDPKGAMNSWVGWAQTQPMGTSETGPGARVDCRIDSAGVSRCTSYAPNPSGKKWNREGVTYTLANDKTQVFKSKGRWVRNNFGADINPFTNTSRFYSYNYWLPWLTSGVKYDTFVDPDGWFSVQSQNPTVGDDQYPVTMVKVAPDGLTAKFLQQYQDGKIAVGQTITLQDVPAVNVPQATKQQP
jgi:hypothetical protein